MEASKVTISPQTLNGPIMTRKRKLKLRRSLILEYIRSKPAGTPISTSELIQAGQYKSYGSGWQQLQTMKKKGIIIQEQIPKSYKSIWIIPGDARVSKPATEDWKLSKNPPYGIPKEVTEKPQEFQTDAVPKGVVGTVQTLYSVENIVQNAKQFAWERNSDSLRDFIASLQ